LLFIIISNAGSQYFVVEKNFFISEVIKN